MATQVNITVDIGNLLKIPAKAMTELTDKACLCIGSTINEAKLNGEKQVVMNIGIGLLSVDLLDMQCKFIPSKDLKTAIKNAIDTQVDPLETTLEKTFIDKLLAICEEVV